MNLEFETLKEIEHIFHAEGFQSQIQRSEGLPIDRLLVLIGSDDQERKQFLEITALEQQLAQGLEKENETPIYLRIQLQYSFPFTMKDRSAADTASLLFFMNRMLEFPGLELDEMGQKIYYRYVFLLQEGHLDHYILLAIVGLIMLIVDVFSEAIEKVATGKTTFNEILEQIVELSKIEIKK